MWCKSLTILSVRNSEDCFPTSFDERSYGDVVHEKGKILVRRFTVLFWPMRCVRPNRTHLATAHMFNLVLDVAQVSPQRYVKKTEDVLGWNTWLSPVLWGLKFFFHISSRGSALVNPMPRVSRCTAWSGIFLQEAHASGKEPLRKCKACTKAEMPTDEGFNEVCLKAIGDDLLSIWYKARTPGLNVF